MRWFLWIRLWNGVQYVTLLYRNLVPVRMDVSDVADKEAVLAAAHECALAHGVVCTPSEFRFATAMSGYVSHKHVFVLVNRLPFNGGCVETDAPSTMVWVPEEAFRYLSYVVDFPSKVRIMLQPRHAGNLVMTVYLAGKWDPSRQGVQTYWLNWGAACLDALGSGKGVVTECLLVRGHCARTLGSHVPTDCSWHTRDGVDCVIVGSLHSEHAYVMVAQPQRQVTHGAVIDVNQWLEEQTRLFPTVTTGPEVPPA
jgi:hypothetical protein